MFIPAPRNANSCYAFRTRELVPSLQRLQFRHDTSLLVHLSMPRFFKTSSKPTPVESVTLDSGRGYIDPLPYLTTSFTLRRTRFGGNGLFIFTLFSRCDGQTFCLVEGCCHAVVFGDLSPWPNLAISAVVVVAPAPRILQALLAPA